MRVSRREDRTAGAPAAAAWLACAVLAALAASGCNSNFEPISYLNNYRVLSVIAEPPEVSAGQRSRSSPWVIATVVISFS